MLSEKPPFYLIDGVSILPDHADPLQFYYQPLSPRFVTRTEGALEIPQLLLLEYRSAGPSGGFLNFDVHLGLSPERTRDLEDQLADLARLRQRPRLSPVPVVGGSVTLTLLGRQSGEQPGGDLVRAIRHSAKPSLYGDNRAAFSVELDERGVTILRQAMLGELSPIGVTYSLDYLALRPAYHVKLRIDWNRTQDIMDETFGHEGLFTDVQIQDVVERLEEERAIVFDTDTFVPEDEESSVIERRNAAVARVRDMITDAFFTSSIDPLRAAPDGWDKTREVIKSFSPQRVSPAGVFSYQKTHYSRVDRKRLDVDLSERVTIARTIYPQGHLTGLFRALQAGLDLERLVLQVNADSDFFKRRKLKLISRADFTRDPVRSVTVALTYGTNPTKSVLLDAARPELEVEWPSVLDGGRMVWPVKVQFTVDLLPGPAGERPARLLSKPVDVLGEEHEIQPRDLFAEESIPILTLPKFPFDRYPRVDVRLRYEDPAGGIRQDDVVRLSAGTANAEWKRFLVGAPAGPVIASISYHGADGRVHETAPAPADKGQVDVPDPFPDRLVVKIVEALSDQVERAFVDLVFDDRDHAQKVEQTVEVVPGQSPESFVVDRVDPTADQIRYRIVVLRNDTTLFEGPWSSTLAKRIFVRDDLRGHRAVKLHAPADFETEGLRFIRIEARANDELAGISVEDRFDFTAPGSSHTFEFDFVDPSKDAYELRVFRAYRNGMSVQEEWTRFDVDTLTIPATTA
ncbi:hypothetical protein [Amycolatopsis anabasis]|uniref:hypothetical protein n=1 Tax=Amycolatopsis anabasis TaxID=1840409 RepID=UPI00131C8C98|nr:hypothetical protein [Amycolatopsis anabasis]